MHSVVDLMHKTARPKTYPCRLCLITYNGATMNKLWRRYVASLNIPTVFMHRNEFAKAYPDQKIKFPVVLLKAGPSFTTILGTDDFKQLKDLGELINILNERLSRA